VNDVNDVIAMASKCSTVNSLVTQSADKEQMKHVDNMHIAVGRIGAMATSGRQERSGMWQYFGELHYRCMNLVIA